MLTKNTEFDGKLWIAGRGKKTARVMLVGPCVLAEEAATTQEIGYKKTIPRTPRMLDCAHGLQLKSVALQGGIDLEECYYTNIVKYLPENRAHQSKPLKTMLDGAWPYLEAEINSIKPDIIVCVGKLAFDCFVDFKAKESDVYGAWFYSKKYHARLYMIPHITQVMKPEKHERFIMDFKAIRRMLDSIDGVTTEKLPMRYEVIENVDKLKQFVDKLSEEIALVLSVDCEWEGHQHVDGKLRSLQIAWSPTDAAYIRFMDDKLNYTFDVSYEEAGKVLGEWLNKPFVKYIGHHISADFMWMSYWLKLEVYQKAIMDTEFAQQCIDEAAGLGLDDLALRYTDFGKYDWDLIMWRKNNPDKRGDGYGQVPDDILIPYAVKDVLTVYRCWPILEQKLKDQDLVRYYRNIHNPFVTDVFTFFGLQGLPIDRKKMDDMRELYQWAKRELEIDFQTAMAKEAEELLKKRLDELGVYVEANYPVIYEKLQEEGPEAVRSYLKQLVGVENWIEMEPVFEHYIIAPNFNIRSKPQMQRWLFDVKKYMPVKSTANKAAGMPSVDWEKIAQYPEEKKALFTPASDTQTLDILAAKYDDAVIRQLLQLNSVGNICKAFLKESDVDDEGNLVKENGLHYWLSSADAVHLNHSCTETGRPRSWNPNVLNWPSYINTKLGSGVTSIIKNRNEKGHLPEKFAKYADMKAKEFPTIRGVCMARPGWCIVEADYQTAEMRGLAFIAEDKELIRMILEPDDCFALVKPECIPPGIDAEDCVVRLKFPAYVTLPADKEKFLMTYSADNEVKATFTEDQLLRDEEGNIQHPRFDMHWGVCELSRHTCRETMNKKKDRGAAKVVNFSSSYGGTATSIARKIEADTGVKPTDEEAQALLDAVELRQPRATIFFKEMERAPIDKGFLRAASGRIRHCHVLAQTESGLESRERQTQLTALGRECRNFFMQESVGASASRACVGMVDFCKRFSKSHGLNGYPFVCLYDSIVVHCPCNERSLWQKVLDLYMNLSNGWQYGPNILRYPTDCELNAGWSTKPTGEFKKQLHDETWEPLPDNLKPVEAWVDSMIELYTEFPRQSVYNK